MSGMNKNVPANLAAAVAALCAGTSVVVTRVAVGEIDPIALAFYRYVVAAACLVLLLPFVRPKVRLPVADIIKIALLGAVFFGFFRLSPCRCMSPSTAGSRQGSILRKSLLLRQGGMSALGQKQTFAAPAHVCFTPESRHVQCNGSCLLWAKSGHRSSPSGRRLICSLGG